MSAGARTGMPRPHQRATVQRRLPGTLRMEYLVEEDGAWTPDAAIAGVWDYLEADRIAQAMGHGHFAALLEAAPDSGRAFFTKAHHDREQEAERSTGVVRPHRPVSAADAMAQWQESHDE